MKAIDILKRILKPPVLGWLAFIVFSTSFSGGYFVLGYQNYLKTHELTQLQEIKTLHKTIEFALEQLGDLLSLTVSTISATTLTTPSLEQHAAIQSVLQSASLLKPSSYLTPLQMIAFYKFSPPQLFITRFNILPLTPADISIKNLKSCQLKSEFILKEKTIIGRIRVGKPKSIDEGVLEIQLNLSEFIQFLGTYQTIQLKEPVESTLRIDKSHYPFLLTKNNPLSFQAYAFSLPGHYWIIFNYLILCLLLLGIGLYIFYKYALKSLLKTIKHLDESIFTLKTTESALKTTVSRQQNEFEAYTISQQAYTSFNHTLVEKQKNQAKQISKILEILKSYYNTRSDEAVSIQMERSLKQATALSNGLWIPSSVDSIDLKNILNNFCLLFAEKLHQCNIHIEIQDLSGLPSFKGDALLIEVFLINVVGKVIYRVPDNGTVFISAKEVSGFLHLQIQDTGYDRVIQAEKIIQKSIGLFMDEEDFKKLCKENGVYLKYSKTNQGHNITQILIPIFKNPEEGERNNVVQLFS